MPDIGERKSVIPAYLPRHMLQSSATQPPRVCTRYPELWARLLYRKTPSLIDESRGIGRVLVDAGTLMKSDRKWHFTSSARKITGLDAKNIRVPFPNPSTLRYTTFHSPGALSTRFERSALCVALP